MKTVGELRKYLKKSHRSPEEVALEFHVSHMTIRRMLRKTDSARLPEKYQVLFKTGLPSVKMVSSKKTPQAEDGMTVSKMVSQQNWNAELNAIGQSDGFKKVLLELVENGSAVDHPEELKCAFEKKIKSENFGKEMITALREVADYAFKGTTLSLRLMCIGALLYFVNVFDLIPDTLGPIGYLDDFAIVALVAGQIHKEKKRMRAGAIGLS